MQEKENPSRKKIFLVPLIITAILGAFLFLPAGSFKYWNGWMFLGVIVIVTFFIAIFFSVKSPDLLTRRMKTKEDASNKTPSIYKFYILGYIVPGFDFRFHWSNIPVEAAIFANTLVFMGYVFIFFVFNENRFASTVIQVEKEQSVIMTGPYKIVRHPMYLGMLVMSLFTPIALGSYWAMLPMLLCIPMLISRIKHEEKTLAENLKGYKEYCEKTPYRLIPFIW